MSIKCATHLESVFNISARNKIVKRITKLIRESELKQAEFIAVSGISGLVIGSIVAQKLEKQLVVIRKRGEITHSGHVVEGINLAHTKYIIIDDLCDTGTTLNWIRDNLEINSKLTLYCVGLILYEYYNKHKFEWSDWIKQIYYV